MERMTCTSLSSTDDDSTENNYRLDIQDERTNLEDTTTICAQNQINDLIIASEVNKLLLAR